MAASVVVIGSSGGGRAASDQTHIQTWFKTLRRELTSAGIKVSGAVIVECASPFDSAHGQDAATLWVLGAAEPKQIIATHSSSLQEVNRLAMEASRDIVTRTILAQAVGHRNDDSNQPLPIDGLVCISCDPEGVHSPLINHARQAWLPIVGTGGSSMGHLSNIGCNVIGAGGSVATTATTRALYYTSVLSKHFGTSMPWLDPLPSYQTVPAIMAALLPVALTSGIAQDIWRKHLSEANNGALELPVKVVDTVSETVDNVSSWWGESLDRLPTLKSAWDQVISQVPASTERVQTAFNSIWTSVKPMLTSSWNKAQEALPLPNNADKEMEVELELSSVLRKTIMAAATMTASYQWTSMPTLSMLSSFISIGVQQLLAPHIQPLHFPSRMLLSGSVLWPLLSAYAGVVLLRPCLLLSYRLSLPATAATMVVTCASGGVGTLVGAVIAYPLAHVWHGGLDLFARMTQAYVERTMSMESIVVTAIVGGLTGLTVAYTSRYGAYHWLYLPWIVTDMIAHDTGLTLLGAHDLCGLCVVSAGACLGAATKAYQHDNGIVAERLRNAGLINLLCGDYVEACYPLCADGTMINWACLGGAAMAGAVIHLRRVEGSAYLPMPLVSWLSSEQQDLVIAVGIAFSIPFVASYWRH